MKRLFEVGHKTNVSHGHSYRGGRSSEYQCWQDIKARCLNPKHKYFSYYGARGITICDLWHDDFEAFLAAVGPRPSSKHTIDRYPDNNGNYEPNNVRWATRKEQSANRRNTLSVELNGKVMPLSDAIRIVGADDGLVYGRITHGWSPERALTAPARWHRPDLKRRAKAVTR